MNILDVYCEVIQDKGELDVVVKEEYKLGEEVEQECLLVEMEYYMKG